jgi:hypothetical protein
VGPAIHFEALPPTTEPTADPSIRIVSPAEGQAIDPRAAAKFKVQWSLRNWTLEKAGNSVLLVLDEFRPRNISRLGANPRLSELVDEDRELVSGEHLLVALLSRPSGETVKPKVTGPESAVASVRFYVGTGKPAEPKPDSSPIVVYNLPRGTYNGPSASDSVLVDFYVLGATLAPGATTATISIREDTPSARRGPASARTTLTALQPLAIRGLQSGDYHVSIELCGADGARLPGRRTHAERTITINRDAPLSKPR